MEPCQHLRAEQSRSESRDFIVYQCVKRGHCTTHDKGVTLLDGSPMPVCATCSQYSRIASPAEKVFTDIAQSKAWGDGETISGPGSTTDATATIREQIPLLLRELGVRSLLDAPCGDHHWMSRLLKEWAFHRTYDEEYCGTKRRERTLASHLPTNFSGPTPPDYIGADIVESIIATNRERFPDRRFERLDIIADKLPQADAVIVRDCLVHLPYYEIGRALQNIVASGARWLITTHFPGRVNHDIRIGSWRPLDLCARPFRLPKPVHVINEGCTEGAGAFADKSLGVWDLFDEATAAAIAKLNKAPRLSICLPVVRGYRDIWFTLQAIKLYHAECHNEIEVIVLDNDVKGQPHAPYPQSEREHSAKTRALCEQYTTQFPCRYIHHTATAGTAAAKAAAIEAARGDAVLVMDSHILLPLAVLRRLIDWWGEHADWNGLLHGPNLRDDIALPNGRPALMGTHHKPEFVNGNWGQWQVDERVYDLSQSGFDIPLAACGLFSFRRAAWLGFVPGEGYVPEEGTLHARYRAAGREIKCAPWLLWDHLYGHTETPAYVSNKDHRLAYYIRSAIQTNEPPIGEIRRHCIDDLKMPPAAVEKLIASEITAATQSRTDTGADCPHRGFALEFRQCEVGCPSTRTAVPIHHCTLHKSPCAPWRWEQTPTMPQCLGCTRFL